MNPETDYKKEIRVALTGLVASLGLIRIENLRSFISIIKSILEHCFKDTGNISILELVLAVSVIICYIGYIMLLGFSIGALYKNKDTILNSLMGAVTAFFLTYMLMLLLLLNQTNLQR